MTLLMPANCQPWRIERNLVRSIAAGDIASFDEMYVAHSRAIYAYLVRLTGDQSTAEDLLQDTFLAAWRGAGRFRGECALRTWLFRIAHHQAVSWWRKQHPAASLDDDEAGDLYETIEDPSATARLAWRNEDLRAALDRLSPKHRAVIELVFAFDMSYADVSAIVRCPIGTVKSRMNYALLYLRRQLSESVPSGGVIGTE